MDRNEYHNSYLLPDGRHLLFVRPSPHGLLGVIAARDLLILEVALLDDVLQRHQRHNVGVVLGGDLGQGITDDGAFNFEECARIL